MWGSEWELRRRKDGRAEDNVGLTICVFCVSGGWGGWVCERGHRGGGGGGRRLLLLGWWLLLRLVV